MGYKGLSHELVSLKDVHEFLSSKKNPISPVINDRGLHVYECTVEEKERPVTFKLSDVVKIIEFLLLKSLSDEEKKEDLSHIKQIFSDLKNINVRKEDAINFALAYQKLFAKIQNCKGPFHAYREELLEKLRTGKPVHKKASGHKKVAKAKKGAAKAPTTKKASTKKAK